MRFLIPPILWVILVSVLFPSVSASVTYFADSYTHIVNGISFGQDEAGTVDSLDSVDSDTLNVTSVYLPAPSDASFVFTYANYSSVQDRALVAMWNCTRLGVDPTTQGIFIFRLSTMQSLALDAYDYSSELCDGTTRSVSISKTELDQRIENGTVGLSLQMSRGSNVTMKMFIDLLILTIPDVTGNIWYWVVGIGSLFMFLVVFIAKERRHER